MIANFVAFPSGSLRIELISETAAEAGQLAYFALNSTADARKVAYSRVNRINGVTVHITLPVVSNRFLLSSKLGK